MAKKSRSLLDGVVFFFNVLAALALALAYLAPYLDPAFISFFALFGLAYPVLLLLNALFALFWALRLKTKILMPLIAIAVGYVHIPRFYQFSGRNQVVNPGESLKVMTYNVRLFNRYEWLDEVDIKGKIKALVEKEKPDILCVQEYYAEDDENDFGFPYHHQNAKKLKSGHGGMVIYSRLPFESVGQIRYRDAPVNTHRGNAIFGDVQFKGEIFRVINVHFISAGLKMDNYARMESPNSGSSEEIKRGFLDIFKKINAAFIARSEQVEYILSEIESSPYPVLLMGDFNDTPHSYAYRELNKYLADSYLEAGSGWAKTYVGRMLPLRIDHIMGSRDFKFLHYDIIYKEYSDHYPVTAKLKWDEDRNL